MELPDKKTVTNGNKQNGVKHPDSFTLAEFIAREQVAEPKGKKHLFYLLIVLTLFWAIIKLPYTIALGVYKRFKAHS